MCNPLNIMNGKILLYTLLVWAASNTHGSTALVPHAERAALSPEAKVDLLSSLPITLYPQDHWVGTQLEDVFMLIAMADDRIMIRMDEGLKAGFRSDAYRVPKSQVWLQLTRPVTAIGDLARHQQGIGGVFLHTFDTISDLRSLFPAADLAVFRDQLKARNMQLAGMLDDQSALQLVNVEWLCTYSDIYVIYDPSRLRGRPEAYVKHVQRQAGWARGANPAIQVEVCIPIPRNNDGAALLYRVLADCLPHADRIGIRFDSSAESVQGLINMLQRLRRQAFVNAAAAQGP
jgi:hypothetical protein